MVSFLWPNERRNKTKLILFLLYNFRALIGAAYRSMKSLCWNLLKIWSNHFITQIWDLFSFFVLVPWCWFDTSDPWVATCFWFFLVSWWCGLLLWFNQQPNHDGCDDGVAKIYSCDDGEAKCISWNGFYSISYVDIYCNLAKNRG